MELTIDVGGREAERKKCLQRPSSLGAKDCGAVYRHVRLVVSGLNCLPWSQVPSTNSSRIASNFFYILSSISLYLLLFFFLLNAFWLFRVFSQLGRKPLQPSGLINKFCLPKEYYKLNLIPKMQSTHFHENILENKVLHPGRKKN